MPHFKFQQTIEQLEKRKGGYYHLIIKAEIVNQFEKKRATRLKCVIENNLTFSCGLNHYGDGNFYIILSTGNLKLLGKNLQDSVSFEIFEDPNPLGVEMPEALEALLEQDENAAEIFDNLTDGKKRSLIHLIRKLKNVEAQIQKALSFLNEQKLKSR